MNFIYPLQGTSSAQQRGAGGLELKKLFFDLFVNMLFFYDLYKLAIHVIFLDFRYFIFLSFISLQLLQTSYVISYDASIMQVELGGEGDQPVLEASLLRRYSKV